MTAGRTIYGTIQLVYLYVSAIEEDNKKTDAKVGKHLNLYQEARG